MPRRSTARPLNDPREVKTLWPHYRSMARMQVAFGYTRPQLALRFSLSKQQITNITTSQLYKAEVRRLEDMADESAIDISNDLNRLRPRSVEIIAEDLMAPEESTKRTHVAFEILDRTGFHKGGLQAGVDKSKQINIYNFTPSPGDDPVEAEKALKKARLEYLDQLSEED